MKEFNVPANTMLDGKPFQLFICIPVSKTNCILIREAGCQEELKNHSQLHHNILKQTCDVEEFKGSESFAETDSDTQSTETNT